MKPKIPRRGVITAGKRTRIHNKIVFLAKAKLNSIEVLISRALTDSYISHYEFVSVDNALKEYDDMKQVIKNPKTINKYGWFNKRNINSRKRVYWY